MKREDENKPCCSKSLPKDSPEPAVDNRVPIPMFSPLSFENKFNRPSVISYSPTSRTNVSLAESSPNGKGFEGYPLMKPDFTVREEKVNAWLNTTPSTPVHLKRKRGDPEEIRPWEFLYEENQNFKPNSENINNLRVRKTIPTCTVTTNFLAIRKKEKEEEEKKKGQLEQTRNDAEKRVETMENQSNDEKKTLDEKEKLVEEKVQSEETQNNNLKDEEKNHRKPFDPRLLKWRPYLDVSEGQAPIVTFPSEEVVNEIECYESVSSGEENDNKWTPNTSFTDSVENVEPFVREPSKPSEISRFVEDFPKTKEQEDMDFLAAITKSINEK